MEAVELRRELARKFPKALGHELARSLRVLGDLLRETCQPGRAYEALAEALVTLLPPLEASPEAFRDLAKGLAKSYIAASGEAGHEPDSQLLDRLNRALKLNGKGEQD